MTLAAALRLAELTATDAPLLAELHAMSFASPWSAASFANLLLSRWRTGHLALLDDEPVGFVLQQRIADEAEILTLCTIPAARRRGAGRRLMEAAIAQAERACLARMILETAVENAPALALYRDLGFKTVGRRRNYYVGQPGHGDALVLARVLVEPAPPAR